MNTPNVTTYAESNLHKRYVRKETLIAVFINSAFSMIFVFIVFGGKQSIALWGVDGLALDFVPQTAIISMITVMVATLLTRKRVRAGEVPGLAGAAMSLPRNAVARALLVAMCATVVLGGLATGVLSLVWNGPYEFMPVLVFKVAYGALVAALVAKVALRATLRDACAVSHKS